MSERQHDPAVRHLVPASKQVHPYNRLPWFERSPGHSVEVQESTEHRRIRHCVRVYRTDFLPYCADGGDALAVRLGRPGTGDALGVLFMCRSKISVVVKSGAEYVTKEFTVPAWLDEEYEIGEYDAHARAKIMSLLVEFMVRYSGLRLSCAGISSLLCRKGFVEVQCMKEAASVGELVDVVESYYGE